MHGFRRWIYPTILHSIIYIVQNTVQMYVCTYIQAQAAGSFHVCMSFQLTLSRFLINTPISLGSWYNFQRRISSNSCYHASAYYLLTSVKAISPCLCPRVRRGSWGPVVADEAIDCDRLRRTIEIRTGFSCWNLGSLKVPIQVVQSIGRASLLRRLLLLKNRAQWWRE